MHEEHEGGGGVEMGEEVGAIITVGHCVDGVLIGEGVGVGGVPEYRVVHDCSGLDYLNRWVADGGWGGSGVGGGGSGVGSLLGVWCRMKPSGGSGWVGRGLLGAGPTS